ncbi:hypothetical protein Trydic_g16400 [Trypoxylus dichotomus]
MMKFSDVYKNFLFTIKFGDYTGQRVFTANTYLRTCWRWSCASVCRHFAKHCGWHLQHEVNDSLVFLKMPTAMFGEILTYPCSTSWSTSPEIHVASTNSDAVRESLLLLVLDNACPQARTFPTSWLNDKQIAREADMWKGFVVPNITS